MGSGLYFHIPFCRSRCSYCHFISLPYNPAVARRYEKAVLEEIEKFPEMGSETGFVDSIYFGGGTPSIVRAEQIIGILDLCRRRFRIGDDCEISIEANPGTLSNTKIAAYRRTGINRISMGAQSFSDRELSAIGRTHSAAIIGDSLHQLKEAGFDNINLDLMLGLPYQTRESWKNNLDIVAGLGIPHVSVYMLDLDDHCPLKITVEKGAISLPEDELISDLYLETIEFFNSCGYRQYEISNFAHAGYECRHNLKYWKRNAVYGFGLGSHSFDGHVRWANMPRMDDYLAAAASRQLPHAWQETIDEEHALQETLFLGLRMAEGVDWNALQQKFGPESLSKYENAIQEWIHKGLIEKSNQRVRLLPLGMLTSNELFQHFV